MKGALLLLMGLRLKAFLRRMRRSMGTPKGLFISLVGFGFAALWLSSILFTGAANTGNPTLMEHGYPLFMFGLLIFSLMGSFGERAIYFSPAEVDQLFTAPFTRRALLAYKLAQTFLGLAFTALIFSLFMARSAPSVIAVYAGVLLSLIFINLVNVIVWMLGALLQQQFAGRLRAAIVVGGFALLAIGGWQAFEHVGALSLEAAEGAEFDAMLRRMLDAPWLNAILVPLAPFGRAAMADSPLPFLGWSSLCLAINAVLFGVIVRMDANYYERAAAISAKIYERMQQMQRTGMAMPAAGRVRWRIPLLPHGGGAGTLAWRQLTTALRAYLAAMALPLAMGLFISLIFAGFDDFSAGPVLGGIAAYMAIFLSTMLRFDFRSDLDVMPLLKTLPLRPELIALGQIFPPALVLTLLQLIVLMPYFVMTGPLWLAPLALLALLPVNCTLFAIDNALFLVAPVRMNAQSAGDPQFMGRQIILMFIKLGVVGIGAAIAGGAGALAAWLTQWNAIGYIVAWLVQAAELAAILPYVAFAFRKFDPAMDTPE